VRWIATHTRRAVPPRLLVFGPLAELALSAGAPGAPSRLEEQGLRIRRREIFGLFGEVDCCHGFDQLGLQASSITPTAAAGERARWRCAHACCCSMSRRRHESERDCRDLDINSSVSKRSALAILLIEHKLEL